MKTCSKCGENKSDCDFHKISNGKLYHHCKKCRSIERKQSTALYRLKHANDIKLNKAINSKRYNKNSAKYKQKWAKDNFEHVSEKRKMYKKINKESINAYNRMRAARKRGNYCEKISRKTIKELKEFFNNSCAYCGASGDTTKLLFDHIYPIAKGGSHAIDNLALCCESCNLHKHAKLPLQWFASIGWIVNVFD